MREPGSTETCFSTPNTIRHMLCVVMIIHTAVSPPMTRRYGPGCAAELSPRRPLHRVVHEIANHPPHINFYQFSQPHIHNNAPPTSFHKNTRKQKKHRWHFLNTLQSNSHPHTFSSAADRSCSHRPTRRCRSACCTTTSAMSGFYPKDARTAGKT